MTAAPAGVSPNGCAKKGHDVREARERSPDPGDAELLRMAAEERRILVAIDTDFGALVYVGGAAHAGIVRLPDVPARTRIALMEQLLGSYAGPSSPA